jgi:O-antigen/teichoic acid export membrane protein
MPLYRNGYALVLSTGAVSALGMAYWVLAAHHYNAEAVGLNAAAISAMTFVSGIAQFNMGGALLRFVPGAGRATKRLVGAAYLATTLAAALVGSLFVLGVRLWSPRLSVFSHPGFALLFVLATMVWGIFAQQDNVLTGLRQAVFVPLENVLYALAKIGLLLALAPALPELGIFVSWNIPAALTLLPVNVLIFRRLIPRHLQTVGDRPEPVVLGQLVTYIAGTYLSTLFVLASTMLLPLLVTQEAGARATAYFYQPWIIVLSLQTVAWNMMASLIVEGVVDKTKLGLYAALMLKQIARLLVPVVVILVVGAPLILRVFRADYALEGAPLLRLLALSVIPGLFSSLYVGVAAVQRRVVRIVIVQGSLCVLALGLSHIFLPIWGLTGVGLAWLASRVIVAAVLMLTQLRPILSAGFLHLLRSSR